MSFTASQRERSGPMLPLAAMVDVLFLLLIFFMTTSIFRDQDYFVEVHPPAIESGQSSADVAPLILTVDPEGVIFIGDRVYDLPTLRETLIRLHTQASGGAVVIRGDANATHGRIMEVKDALFQAGFRDVSEAVVRPAP